MGEYTRANALALLQLIFGKVNVTFKRLANDGMASAINVDTKTTDFIRFFIMVPFSTDSSSSLHNSIFLALHPGKSNLL